MDSLGHEDQIDRRIFLRMYRTNNIISPNPIASVNKDTVGNTMVVIFLVLMFIYVYTI